MLENYYFYKFLVNNQVFFKSSSCFAIVNLKPIVPGHVLVVSNRVISRFCDLTDEEAIDYTLTLRKVCRFIEYYYKADALNIAIQDGYYSGQSIPHLHTHVIPRYKSSNFGDEIYKKIDQFNEATKVDYLKHQLEYFNTVGHSREWSPGSDERIPRTDKDMKLETQILQKAMQEFLSK